MKFTSKIQPLSTGQSYGWYWTSLLFGIFMVFFAIQTGYLTDQGTFVFATIVFGTSWIVGVVGLRFYIQEVDPTDFMSILGLRKK